MNRPLAAFAISLVQDIAVLRPMAILAGQDLGFDVRLILLPGFRSRHLEPAWSNEISRLADEAGASIVMATDDLDAFRCLQNPGLLVSASESSLAQHTESRRLFELAPAHIVRVTVQHGYECPGFLHGQAHDAAYGRSTAFAADILCGWAPSSKLASMAPAERRKLWVTGPPAAALPVERRIEGDAILVCENLHSVRYSDAGNFLRNRFLTEFQTLCDAAGAVGREVVLRPHPGGRYLERHHFDLPDNARIDSSPLYRGGLDGVGCAIAPPSSVVIDLLLADIPTALWPGTDRALGNENYRGLLESVDGRGWWDFAVAANNRRDQILAIQKTFLTETEMPFEVTDVRERLARLLQSVARRL